MKIAVLGAGMVGRAIALDLIKDYSVTSFDLSNENLGDLKRRNAAINIEQADLSLFGEYKKWLHSFDVIVCAVPGFMGYKTLEAIIHAGKNVVDISFFPEDALQLDQLAKKKKITAITDCGVAPGASNFIIGRYNEEMNVSSFECYVGGLPVEKKPPFQYKAPFSPVDVIQEYIRPARMVEDGQVVTKAALSDREMMLFDEIGELEAFNTDGLRSLIFTMNHIPDMKEKTLRYPGHIDLIISLKQAGFFEAQPLQIKGQSVSPLEFTSQLLINEWKLEPTDEEFTVMRVIVKGNKNDKQETIVYDLLDRYDKNDKISSMSRTTGYTCTAAVNLITKNLFTSKGVFPPELIGRNKECFDFVFSYLKARGVNWKFTRESE